MSFKTAREDIVDGLSGPHRERANVNCFAALRLDLALIEVPSYIIDPLFFFRAVRKYQFQRSSGSLFAGCVFMRGIFLLAAAKAEA